MKRTILGSLLTIVLIALMLSGSACAGSQKAGPGRAGAYKIGVIDTNRIVRESKAAEAARAVLLQDLNEKRATYKAKQTEVVQLQEGLRQMDKSADASTINEKRDALAKEIKRLKRLKIDMEEEINNRNKKLTQRILNEIAGVVQAYSKKENFTLILERKTVVTFDESIDITEAIIQLYDKRQ